MENTQASPRRIVILISGGGTNFQALMDAITAGTVKNAQIIRCISNRKASFGLTRAQAANIPTTYHNLLPFKKRFADHEVDKARLAYDAELANIILLDKPDLVACLGFMHILTPAFLEPIAKANITVVNLHPSLLPGDFDGIDAIERAHQAWLDGEIEYTGVRIHHVITEVDHGRPIISKKIDFVKGHDEDVEKFKAKVHALEWEIVPQGVAMALDQRDRPS